MRNIGGKWGYKMGITQAILKLRIEYAQRGHSPKDINGGLCADFADDIISRFGLSDGVAVWGEEVPVKHWSSYVQKIQDWFSHFAICHCFIWYRGKFYDSETPQGCDYPDQLLCYQRNINYLLS